MPAQKALLVATQPPNEAAPYLPLLTLAQVRDLPGSHVFVPMPEDRFAPAIRCGDFVVVDTDRRDLTEGSLVWLKYSTNTAFALLRGPSPFPYVDGSYGMAIAFGMQTVCYLNGKRERWSMGDSVPLPHLRDIIAGHVVGILGKDASSFNWRAL